MPHDVLISYSSRERSIDILLAKPSEGPRQSASITIAHTGRP
jgi:hypothetical protein